MILRSATALMAAGLVETMALPAVAADDFPAVVTEILRSQTEGRISEMGERQKAAMIDCVNAVLMPLAKGKKRYILAGQSFEEREERFGKVLYADHAKWVQAIAKGCSAIAVSHEYD